VLLLSRQEWMNNKDLNTLDVGTALHPWSIAQEAGYVAVVSDPVFDQLSRKHRDQILYEQWRLGRGQVVSVQWIMDTVLENVSSAVRVQFLLARAKLSVYHPSLWSDLSPEEKQRITELNPIIATYTDTFCAKNGPNCFTTALVGATSNPVQAESLLTHWMIVEPFLNGMMQRGYTLYLFATEDIQANDLLVWFNAEGNPVHACYAPRQRACL
jgi:hypothetical protein